MKSGKQANKNAEKKADLCFPSAEEKATFLTSLQAGRNVEMSSV